MSETTAASFVMVKELPAWMPGKPEAFRQTIIWANGSGQAADIVDKKVVRLFDTVTVAKGTLSAKDFFKFSDSYDSSASPGLIVEGRGDKTVFVVQADGKNKFIAGRNELMPKELSDYRSKIQVGSTSHTGAFISASLQPEVAMADLRKIPTLALADAKILKEYPALKEALASPFKFVPLAPDQQQKLMAALKLSPASAFVKTTNNEIVRIEFYQ